MVSGLERVVGSLWQYCLRFRVERDGWGHHEGETG